VLGLKWGSRLKKLRLLEANSGTRILLCTSEQNGPNVYEKGNSKGNEPGLGDSSFLYSFLTTRTIDPSTIVTTTGQYLQALLSALLQYTSEESRNRVEI
jgi:hypothetical protein